MLEIERAEGCWLYDVNEKKYLDLISGISVSNLGHNHPVVKNAIREQLEKYSYLMVYGEFIQSPQVKLAQWLAAHLPGQLSTTYFTNSGTEAVEGALKLAKRFTGRTEIISFRNSYHGSTMGALSLGNQEERKNAFRPLIPGNRIMDYNHFDQLEDISKKTAAVIMEVVQAEAGVILPAENYLQDIRERCNQTGALLLFDECQTGMGRTGSLFGFQQYSVVPDVIILGKAFGGGMPLGAFVSSKEIMQSFMTDPVLGHLTTFGGHPVCCAAGLATAEELMKNKLIDDVGRKAELFRKGLSHPLIKSFRNSGLMIAVEFGSPEMNFELQKRLTAGGLLVDWFLFAPGCLRMAPPLVISDEEIKFAINLICKVLDGFDR